LRDFFWLAVVVAMGTAWWLDRSALERREEIVVLESRLKELNGQIISHGQRLPD
jgi:hypothetical protein